MIRGLNRESEQLRESICELVVHMNGGLDYDLAWGLSYVDRATLVRSLNKKIRQENPRAKEMM